MFQRPRILAVAGAMVLGVWLGIGGVPQANACQGADVVNRAGAAFLSAAREGSASAFANALQSYADMEQITLFALGRYGNQLHPSRRSELTFLTSRYVATTLADFARKFRGSSIEAIRCSPGEVISRFQRGARAERITWRVSNNKVTDVHIQNVWLGQVLRDNYAGIIQRGGGSIDALFFHLGARSTADTSR
jgi:ABC-type transporter MlaC component